MSVQLIGREIGSWQGDGKDAVGGGVAVGRVDSNILDQNPTASAPCCYSMVQRIRGLCKHYQVS